MEEFSADDELRGFVQSLIGSSEHVVMALYVEMSMSSWGTEGRAQSKRRIIAVAVKPSTLTKKMRVRLLVFVGSSSALEIEKVHELRRLSRIEGVLQDKSGRTFILNFDVPQDRPWRSSEWTTQTLEDRNRLLTAISKLCKKCHGRAPKLVGIDVVEMQLWAKKNAKILLAGAPDVMLESFAIHEEEIVNDGGDVEIGEIYSDAYEELVSKDEEEDMDALLGMYVLGIDEADAFSERLTKEVIALDTANVHAILENAPIVDEVTELLDMTLGSVEDLEEWISTINVKIRYMREDIAAIESANNCLETQVRNNSLLLKELHLVSDRFRVPPEYAETLKEGTFEEVKVAQNVEACKWLATALRDLQPPYLEPSYASMRAIREKRDELEKLKRVFLKRATSFLCDYFSSVIESTISDKDTFSTKGKLRKPVRDDLRFKCRTYARMIKHMKVREFANELRSSTVAKQTNSVWLDRLESSKTQSSPVGESTVSEAYSRMLRTFIPFLVDESSFFASFMCFEVQLLTPQVDPDDVSDDSETEARVVNVDDTVPNTQNQQALESKTLKEALRELLDGIQEDFYAVIKWAHRQDPWSCISMQGATEKYLSSHKADAAWFVHGLLDDLQVRISNNFNQVVAETSKQFERTERNQAGVLYSIIKFAKLTTLIEFQIVGRNSRGGIDAAYEILAGTIFSTIENIGENDPKNFEIFAIDNYAAFQDRMYELAAVTPVLEKFYIQATDSYAQACQQYVQTMINYQFERFTSFVEKVEVLLLSTEPGKVSSMPGFTKSDLRKKLKSSLSGVEKSLTFTYKRMQKSIQRQDILTTLWNQYFKPMFFEKYKALEEILSKCYKEESLKPSSADMKIILDRMLIA
uniref:Exocyst complex component Sec3 PIP2-binding N-terminal domain-containing protein n=1 Tax=Physcomitrium patens TaxID=3218 RepID=A0A7I4BSK5_PHYPA